MEEVHGYWSDMCQTIKASEKTKNDWWSIVSRRYSEEWRFYHTLQHLADLFDLFSQWKEIVMDLVTLRLAIFFHDIVYDPMAKDNEMQSIVVFQKFAIDAKLPPDTVNRVSDMIQATITHSVPAECKDLDLCLFLDFDMAVLGAESEVYSKYAVNIRKEYCHLDDKQFSAGRSKVLNTMLDSKHIYSTEELRDIYEAQARKNMENELNSL